MLIVVLANKRQVPDLMCLYASLHNVVLAYAMTAILVFLFGFLFLSYFTKKVCVKRINRFLFVPKIIYKRSELFAIKCNRDPGFPRHSVAAK